jgi:putative ABC transport system permease protein
VSENLARRYWPNRNPIGRRIRFGGPDSRRPWATVVGVVADVKTSSLEREPATHSYEPLEQVEAGGARTAWHFVIRASGDPTMLASAVRASVQLIDPSLPVSELRTMTGIVDASLTARRFNTWLLAAFAVLALLLAMLGIYGVIAFSVVQRTEETGIRMALGARTAQVAELFLREGLLLVAAGIGIGAAGSMALSHSIADLLYGVKPIDPLTIAAVSAMLLPAAVAAAWVPACRARSGWIRRSRCGGNSLYEPFRSRLDRAHPNNWRRKKPSQRKRGRSDVQETCACNRIAGGDTGCDVRAGGSGGKP